ncbi:MAG: cupin domain-containing protein [Planctomycetota bacterium]
MKRGVGLLVAGLVFGVVGTSLAHRHNDGEQVKLLKVWDIEEKLAGKDASVSAVSVTIDAGQAGAPHRHPGPAFVYVIEGTYELGVDDQPTKIFHAGEVFFEPSGSLHRVSKNPATKGRTRLVAFVLHPRDAKEIAVPETKKQ